MIDRSTDGRQAVSRREALSLLGVGGLAIAGITRAFKPELLIDLTRAAGEPISVERTITDETSEYDPVTGTVRYPTRIRSNGEPAAFSSQPFETWARGECAAVGSEAVLPAIQDRFESDLTGVGKSISEPPLVGRIITVRLGKSYDRDGNVISEPNISMSELTEAAPRTVHATVTFADREYTWPVPVFVREVNSHLL